MHHKVVQVYPIDDYKVYIYFIDGVVKIFDAKELITQGVFVKLQDKDLFKNSCTVLNNTLAWDLSGRYDAYNCLDLDPDYLYETCETVNDPLSASA
jgi:hypothetical protein